MGKDQHSKNDNKDGVRKFDKQLEEQSPGSRHGERINLKQLWGVGGFIVLAFVLCILVITCASRYGGGFWRFIAAIVASFVVLVVLAVIGRFMGVFGEGTVAKFLDAALTALKLGIGKDKEDQKGDAKKYSILQDVLQLFRAKDRARKDVKETKIELVPPEKIFTAKLPVTGRELFGREKELELFDEAWGAGHTHIVSLVAWGGVGKSALVNEWLGMMEAGNWRGAERVYGWSFYSQGTREDRQASGDEFLAHALEWFGDEDPKKGSPWDKGVRLAGLIRGQRTLLILDGLEPLQYPPGEMEGRLKDQGLQGLLRELSMSNNGLCVITTRVAVKDIDKTVDKTTQRVLLDDLSDDAGMKLLRSLGVKNGTDKELSKASGEFGNHALALNLLGRYLAVVHEGEVQKRDLIDRLMYKGEQAEHARHVMESYEIWMEGKAELDILYVMGLFDRPADEGAIKVLREKPAIKGLTERIVKLDEADWKFAVEHLRDLRLLAKEDVGEKGRLDCHPLIREHFGAKLKEGNPAAWREAHGRLYEYYRDLPEKEQPDTLEEMEPLFCAVAHGCAAGRHQETHDEVYFKRIRRKNEYYIASRLGATGSWLSVVSSFFEKPWSQIAPSLNEKDKAILLGNVGSGLHALGRLREAAEPMNAATVTLIEQKNWKEATKIMCNLSELYLGLGEVEWAVEYARRGVEFADRSEDLFHRLASRAGYFGDVLHQSGKIGKAEKFFREAEGMQKEYQPGCEYLYSVRGFNFCDLLLGKGKYGEVKRRAAQTIEIAQRNHWLLDMGLDRLSLGRAYMLEAEEKGLGEFGKARGYLDGAVAGLREAGRQQELPKGLLARSALYRHTGEFKDAWRDLGEAREIAERGEMRLYLADCALEGARLNLAEGQKDDARAELEKAKGLVEETGYHRRDQEVQELLAVL